MEALASFERALGLGFNAAAVWNEVAWYHATAATAELHDPAAAVELARKAVAATPGEGSYWNTFGIALYRAGEWRESLDALAKSMELRAGGDAYDWLFAAMARTRIGERDRAREFYDKAAAWMDEHAPDDPQLRRFREEAAELLRAE